jgi:HD-GYP domain-containing protein (c-di-GMP phosphodiesterase class II)
LTTGHKDSRIASSGVQLAEVVGAIALAADLGLGQPLDHVLRSCVVATRFAEHLGVSREDRDATYWTTLFMTAGCTGSSYELSEVFGDDIAFRAGIFWVPPTTVNMLRFMLGRAGSGKGVIARVQARANLLRTKLSAVERALIAHCHVSARLAERVGLGERVVTSLLQTFARWDGKGLPSGLAGDDILLPIRITNIANVVTAHAREQGVAAAAESVRPFSGTDFDPRLCNAWRAAAPDVLSSIEGQSSWERVVADQAAGRAPLTEGELDDALELIADYADLKSPWFTGHSRSVASLAAAAARRAQLPESEVISLRRAALVHDIGRNGVPNSIWDKRGPLSDSEMERVQLHAYYTDRVLRRAGKLAELASVASAAHERIGGGGYPRQIGGLTIPLLGRYLEAADVYQAMLEDRPHRPAHSYADAGVELRRAAHAGELDGSAVDAVLTAAGHATRSRPSAPAGLTPRETEVLVLASRGGTIRSVAQKLDIAPKTAGNHLEHIYSKIGVSTRAEAAMFAMQHGLLPDWQTPQT